MFVCLTNSVLEYFQSYGLLVSSGGEERWGLIAVVCQKCFLWRGHRQENQTVLVCSHAVLFSLVSLVTAEEKRKFAHH